MAKRKHIAQEKWSDADRQAFADRNILRANRIPDKRKRDDKKACRNFRWQG